MTASKRFAKAVAKCRANFEKNSAAHRTGWRMWAPHIPGMNNPLKTNGEFSNYFNFLWKAHLRCGITCREVNPDNAQKLRWCGLLETKKVNGVAHYFATKFGHEYIDAAYAYFVPEA